ncbi:MAG: sulfatase-like hydrolase/transferase [Geminicoccaceae bacterium]
MRIILTALLFLAGTVVAAPLSAAPRNVLLILADDYGIDVTEYYPAADRRTTKPLAPKTPNLAALSKQGIIFRNAWAEPSCSPSRATIFTGRYAFRTGIGKPVPQDLSSPPPVLSADEFSLPEAFAASGRNYYLAHVGKWHLSRGIDDPRIHGWPHFTGPHPDLAHLPDYFDWPKVVDGVEVNPHEHTYATTDEVNDALAAMSAAKTAGQPFFIWLALSAPHSPYQKPPNDLHTRDSLPATGTSKALRRSYYEAMIEAMDTEIGRLLKSVDLATTTVIFLGDNGTPNEVTASPYSPDHAKLRVYEQGVRVPMIVAGSGLKKPGRKLTQLVNTVDIYPTVLQLAGIDPATVLAGRKIDGVSFLRYIDNSSGAAIRPYAFAEKFDLLWNEKTEYAIRDPRYKLIERVADLKWPAREFFDLKKDPYEKKNLLKKKLTNAQKKKLNKLNSELDKLIATR